MLSKYDEFLCHQIVSTFDHVDTSALQRTERNAAAKVIPSEKGDLL
jgi:hypothetical protein